MSSTWTRAIIFTTMLVIGLAMVSALSSRSAVPAEVQVPLSQVVTLSQQHDISSLKVNGQWLNIDEKNGVNVKSYAGDTSIFDITGLDLTGVNYQITPAGFDWGSLLELILPLLLIGAVMLFFFSRSGKGGNQAMSIGRSSARQARLDRPSVTFADVAGVDEAKQELNEVVDFLKSREQLQKLGGRIPRGVLLVGPPGSGKTLLARAVSGEARVPFFSISGSEFVEMFVGVGAARVRDLFEQAKRTAPCIVFVDEIDAVGRSRGAGLGFGNDEREQTLNQILIEMDGFDTNTGVIVIAATNRPDVLDPALLRPGRFDRRVVLDLPDVNGRAAILKVHSKGKPLSLDVNLEGLAKQTTGFSGADLSNLMNESAILAARRGKKAIGMVDLEDSVDKVLLGPERRSRRLSAKDKEITAYHEAGHALVARMTPEADPPHKVSIIPRGFAGGYTRSLQEDRAYWSRSKILADITTAMGGYAAEKLIFNEITNGGSQDIKVATDLARRMVTEWGMSQKFAPRTFGEHQELIFLGREISEQRDYGEKIANEIDEEVHGIIDETYARASHVLTENKEKLNKLAQRLTLEETIEGDTLEAALS